MATYAFCISFAEIRGLIPLKKYEVSKFARPWPRACQITDYVFQKISETNQFGNTFSDKKNGFEQQFLQFVLKLLFLLETIVSF